MMESVRTYETLVKLYQSTRRYYPEDSHLPARRRSNKKKYETHELVFVTSKTNLEAILDKGLSSDSSMPNSADREPSLEPNNQLASHEIPLFLQSLNMYYSVHSSKRIGHILSDINPDSEIFF
jgi:hypothetical protein